MNELLAKLTNLGYELFGVLIPGLIALLFILIWWNALGALAPLWTSDVVPELTVATARSIVDSFNVASGIGVAIPAFAICYFAGHILLWISRSGGASKSACSVGWKRISLSLVFRIPKPEASFSTKLQRLYDKVQAKFAPDGIPLEWREFYPVVKSFLSQHVINSLVPTYQNKYTLHRSITTASALLFWLCIVSLIGAWRSNASVPPLNYGMLVGLALGAIFLVWGFSSSYIYHWEMFGNTVITESYCRIFGPQYESKK